MSTMDAKTQSWLRARFAPEAIQRLEQFVALLLHWNKAINLISRHTVDEVWTRHIIDSLQVVEALSSCSHPYKILTDFGSGAGFPGLVLALVLHDKEIHLIESDKRKSIFLQEAAALIAPGQKTQLSIHNARIEKLESWQSDIVTARALASVSELIEYTLPFWGMHTEAFFLKGGAVQQECQDASRLWNLDYKKIPSITATDGCILHINTLRRKEKLA